MNTNIGMIMSNEAMPPYVSDPNKRIRDMRRPIAHAYALSTLKELEPMNDDCSVILMKKFDKYVGQNIDLGKWVHVS